MPIQGKQCFVNKHFSQILSKFTRIFKNQIWPKLIIKLPQRNLKIFTPRVIHFQTDQTFLWLTYDKTLSTDFAL